MVSKFKRFFLGGGDQTRCLFLKWFSLKKKMVLNYIWQHLFNSLQNFLAVPLILYTLCSSKYEEGFPLTCIWVLFVLKLIWDIESLGERKSFHSLFIPNVNRVFGKLITIENALNVNKKKLANYFQICVLPFENGKILCMRK